GGSGFFWALLIYACVLSSLTEKRLNDIGKDWSAIGATTVFFYSYLTGFMALLFAIDIEVNIELILLLFLSIFIYSIFFLYLLFMPNEEVWNLYKEKHHLKKTKKMLILQKENEDLKKEIKSLKSS